LDPGPREGICEPAARVGSFEIALKDGFTNVQGKVENAVSPALIPEHVSSEGVCHFLRPASLFCDPACTAGTTCDASGACVLSPEGISVGEVTIEGLKSEVTMSASAPVFFYNFLGDLPHPGFDEGASITLRGAGEDPVAAFALGSVGITALEVSATSVSLQEDQAVQLSWQEPANAEDSSIFIELNIAQHGGTPGRIECEVPDTGSFEIPVALSNALLAQGYSGFPSLTLSRTSADSTQTALGCLDLRVQSDVTLEVEIDGLTSCSGNEDCISPETCQPDLTCG
jgi:hypothetical protein